MLHSHVCISVTETGTELWDYTGTRRRGASSVIAPINMLHSHVSISATETGRRVWEMTQTQGDDAFPPRRFLGDRSYQHVTDTRLHFCHWNREAGVRDDTDTRRRCFSSTALPRWPFLPTCYTHTSPFLPLKQGGGCERWHRHKETMLFLHGASSVTVPTNMLQTHTSASRSSGAAWKSSEVAVLGSQSLTVLMVSVNILHQLCSSLTPKQGDQKEARVDTDIRRRGSSSVHWPL